MCLSACLLEYEWYICALYCCICISTCLWHKSLKMKVLKAQASNLILFYYKKTQGDTENGHELSNINFKNEIFR